MPVPLSKMMETLSPKEREEVQRGAQEIIAQSRSLAEVRKALRLTQDDLAKALKTTQSNVAQIERKKDVMVSTLARVVKAMGGRLQLTVALPGKPPVALQLGETKGELALKKREKRRRTTAVTTGGAKSVSARARG
jgi:transcriptional regulator with XRE-family HTH domain